MDAIILAGGFGTRLAETVPGCPKALAPIERSPFLDLLLDQLEKSKIVSRLIFSLGHRANEIIAYLESKNFSLPLLWNVEPKPLGTGGAILDCLEKSNSETVLILNGDSFFDISFGDFYRYHQDKKSDFTIACREVEDAGRFGSLTIGANHRILRFLEKTSQNLPGTINGGIYLCQKTVFKKFPKIPCSLEKDLFPQMVSSMYAYTATGFFIDIGTKNSYTDAQTLLKPWICR